MGCLVVQREKGGGTFGVYYRKVDGEIPLDEFDFAFRKPVSRSQTLGATDTHPLMRVTSSAERFLLSIGAFNSESRRITTLDLLKSVIHAVWRSQYFSRTTSMKHLFLFSALLVAIGTLAADPLPADRQEEIKKIEKQIADLEAKLHALQDRELLPQPKSIDTDILPASWINPMRWRNIGPATMGGRITSLAVCPTDTSTYWVATASGGLLKTVNNGVTFEHQFDREATVSIGAVAVAPSNKDVVWVGTGEANPRNSVSFGDGVYKSTDGGKTWKNMGLKQSFQIGKIVIHPKDPDVVYVGVLGRLYGPNHERGLYKTTDGGKTWDRVGFVNEHTGVIDVAMHSNDPETLVVATWERRRDEFDSFRGDAKHPGGTDAYAPSVTHGAGSGLYRTTDGGRSFVKLTDGLPTCKMGRIGLDWSVQNPATIFAIIDTEKAGMGNPPKAPQNVGYLGIIGEDSPSGAKLTTISEGSPAEKAGLKADDVITHFNEQPVKNYEALLAELRKKKPNDQIKFTVLRSKDTKQITATLGVRNPVGKAANPPAPSLGIMLDQGEGGLLITEILPKSPAELAGLKVDDVIISIDGTDMTDRRVIGKMFAEKKVGEKVKVVYRRGKEKAEVVVTLDIVKPGTADRPNSTGQLGGQVENAQEWQGPEGVETGGLFKSTDRGQSWTRVNSINPRPFYFSVVRVDPNDEQNLYVLGVDLYRSTDGGKKFSSEKINAGLHSDQHDLWIDPSNSKHLLMGSDGGLYVTYDAAANWEHLNRMALGQFYHVCVDSRVPYRVYGGLQDNGTWSGPSNTRNARGPINEDWSFVNGGDGFQCQVDPRDPNLVYAESQDGAMMRRNLKTGASNFIRPIAQQGLGRYRFNWNTPMLVSQHNPNIFYAAGNYVFRSLKQGDDLRLFSPEITRTKRGSGTALAESPRNPDVLWVGTDDGAVHVTRDAGKIWTNVAANFAKAGLTGARWVSSIEASRWEDGRAYVVFDVHRSDDEEPYVYVTENFGQTWRSLRGNLPDGPTRVLREDRFVKDLLYLGTEFAIWTSINRGKSWTKLNGTSLPTVAIHEIAQPATANEIVVATHGRGIWILDVAALRQITPTVARMTTPKLLNPSPVIRWQIQPGTVGPFSVSQRRFIGQNPPFGATIDYILPERIAKASLKIVDISGRTVAELKPQTTAGLHRLFWNLQVPPPKKGEEAGIPLLTGTGIGVFRIVLTVDGVEQNAPLIVEGDPNAPREAMSSVDEVEEERAERRREKLGYPREE